MTRPETDIGIVRIRLVLGGWVPVSRGNAARLVLEHTSIGARYVVEQRRFGRPWSVYDPTAALLPNTNFRARIQE